MKTLEENGYDSLELLLTPLQYGIPNSRLRYYLLAKARPKQFSGILNRHSNQLWRHIPNDTSPKSDSDNGCPATEIRRYLDRDIQTACSESLQIPDRVLERWGRLFDIVLPSSQRTCCFTRGTLIRSPEGITAMKARLGYTQLVERAGSILQTNEELDVSEMLEATLLAGS